MSTSSDERLGYKAREFAQLTGLSRTRVYELIASGELRAVRIGGRVVIDAEAAKAWFANLPEYQAS
jgi:excisionase family DNA binding protein